MTLKESIELEITKIRESIARDYKVLYNHRLCSWENMPNIQKKIQSQENTIGTLIRILTNATE